MTPWKVVAFHTDDDLFNGHVENLRKSLIGLDIPHYTEKIHPIGNWMENVAYKPEFILSCLDKFRDNLVYIDADAVVREYPVLFDTIQEDIAVHYRDGVEMLAGTLYFKNCEENKSLIKEWIDLIKGQSRRMRNEKTRAAGN
jgi:hypothetical protein